GQKVLIVQTKRTFLNAMNYNGNREKDEKKVIKKHAPSMDSFLQVNGCGTLRDFVVVRFEWLTL
ncbi:hypothetical protein ACJX0J_012094, partial [Zea mays]